MNNWNTAVCETNQIYIHYTRTGDNKPPVILLHGLMTNGACWYTLAHTLADEYDVIMPDARGHGKSSVPDAGYRYEDHSNDVIGLIKALKLSSPILVGHSMGAITAALVASRNPNILRGLVLADPAFLSPKVQREVYDSDVAEQHRKILNKSLNEVVSDGRIRHPNRSLETIKLFAKARLETNLKAFDVLKPPNPEFRKLVSAINVPSLLVIGDRDCVVSPAVAAELQLLNPKIHVQQIPDAGHALPYDQPKRFAAITKTFLRSLEG